MKRQLAILFAVGLVGCGLDPHSRITIEDPTGAAASATYFMIGAAGVADGTERRERDGRPFPMRVTVIVSAPGVRTVKIDAFDSAGTLVALGQHAIDFEDGGSGAHTITLGAPCEMQQQCAGESVCGAVAACIDGACIVDVDPCRQVDPCVTSAKCNVELDRCEYTVDHDACDPVVGIRTFCSPVSGCSIGQPCQDASECIDGRLCTTDECDLFQCVYNPVENDDGNPCTLEVCDEVLGPRNVVVGNGPADACSATSSTAICLDGQCVESLCGDQHTDTVVLEETCDDGRANPNDGCAACQQTQWDASVVSGLGVSAGRPQDTPIPAPFGLDVDDAGNVFVTDVITTVVVRRDASSGVATVIAGGGASNDPGVNAFDFRFWIPVAVAVDSQGDVFVADGRGIWRLDGATQSIEEVVRGSGVLWLAVDRLGNLVMASDAAVFYVRLDVSPPSLEVIAQPTDATVAGVAVDIQNRVHYGTSSTAVPLYGVHRIDNGVPTRVATLPTPPSDLAIDLAGVMHIASLAGATIYRLDGNGLMQYEGFFLTPHRIALDPSDVPIYIELGTDRVLRYATPTPEVVMGPGRRTFDGLRATALQGFPLNPEPAQVTFDANGKPLIAMLSSINQLWTVTDEHIESLAGSTAESAPRADGPADQVRLRNPWGLAYDETDGAIFVTQNTSTDRYVLRVHDGQVTTVYDGEDLMDAPRTLQLHNGTLYVTDELGVQTLPRTGGVATPVVGARTGGFAIGDGAIATSVGFTDPPLSVVAPNGDLYIGDRGTSAVYRVVNEGGRNVLRHVVTTMAPPNALAFCQHLYVAEGHTGGVIRRYDANGSNRLLIGGGGTQVVDGYTAAESLLDEVDSMVCHDGGLFVSRATNRIQTHDPNGVRRIDLTTRVVTTLLGSTHPRGDGRLGQGRLTNPHAVVEHDGAFLVTDGVEGVVRRADFANDCLETVVGVASGRAEEGASAAAAALLEDARGIAVDPSGAIYLTEAAAHVIRRIDTTQDPWTITTFAGRRGEAGAVVGTRSESRFDGPTGLAFDAVNDRLIVADTGNHVVRSLDVGGGANAQFGVLAGTIGIGAHSGDGLPATGVILDAPEAVAVDRNGHVYIAETGYGHIRVVYTSTIATVGDRDVRYDEPRGVHVDDFGNVFFTATDRVYVAVKGADRVDTIYGDLAGRFPDSETDCLSGLTVAGDDAGRLLVVDRCSGFLIALDRVRESRP